MKQTRLIWKGVQETLGTGFIFNLAALSDIYIYIIYVNSLKPIYWKVMNYFVVKVGFKGFPNLHIKLID